MPPKIVKLYRLHETHMLISPSTHTHTERERPERLQVNGPLSCREHLIDSVWFNRTAPSMSHWAMKTLVCYLQHVAKAYRHIHKCSCTQPGSIHPLTTPMATAGLINMDVRIKETRGHKCGEIKKHHKTVITSTEPIIKRPEMKTWPSPWWKPLFSHRKASGFECPCLMHCQGHRVRPAAKAKVKGGLASLLEQRYI